LVITSVVLGDADFCSIDSKFVRAKNLESNKLLQHIVTVGQDN